MFISVRISTALREEKRDIMREIGLLNSVFFCIGGSPLVREGERREFPKNITRLWALIQTIEP